jgi:serine/threonine-protein kinase HipA
VSAKDLVALIAGAEIGRVQCDASGRLRFQYAEAWRRRDDALHLSLSMPPANPEHGHASIHTYLWGLLPDNEVVLGRWGQRFHVSPRNAFALLGHVGEECAGAVQFVRPERLADLQGVGPLDVAWLDELQVADRLRALREDQGAWRSPRDTGQFSLAGAQPKTALLLQQGRFGVPAGRTPTTHILKPPHRDRPGHVENEHVCLALARELGLAAASAEVRRFGTEVAIVVARYDRVSTQSLAAAEGARAAALAAVAAAEAVAADARATANSAAAAAEAAARAQTLGELAKSQPILRLHQEDLCQALGVHPASKYESEGGPSAARIVQLLRAHSSSPERDVGAFVDALIFNWLVAGTDGHAKNYSLLHAAGGRVRLAPLYDLASALPHPDLDPRRLRLAMRVGSTYRIHDIGARQWATCAKGLGLDPDAVIARARTLAGQIPDRVRDIEQRVVAEGLDAAVIQRLTALLNEHVQRCVVALHASA